MLILIKYKEVVLLTTERMEPPEISNDKKKDIVTISTDKMHAWMLGKNLYQYLTSYADRNDNRTQDLKFEANLFKTVEGKAFKTLIEELVKTAPKERISVTDALQRLAKIKKISEEKNNILKITQEIVDDIVGNLEKRSKEWFSIGMIAKANNIKTAMEEFKSHLQEHGAPNYISSAAYKKLEQAMATHRHFGKSGKLYTTTSGTIDETKAAKTFIDFKKSINDALKNTRPTDGNPVENTGDENTTTHGEGH